MTEQFVRCTECNAWTDKTFRGPDICDECQKKIDAGIRRIKNSTDWDSRPRKKQV